MVLLHHEQWSGRNLILLFDCTLVFGVYFCIDIPSALQSYIQNKQDANCTQFTNISLAANTSCCTECLGLGPDRYNQLYAIFSWTNAILVLPVGVFIDRVGNRFSGLLFTGLASCGSLLFAVSLLDGIKGTSSMFYLMMAGRFLLGTGTGSSRIVQDRVIAVWFPDKLALAFGLVVTTLRLGSVLNFVLTANTAEMFGLAITLWIGAGVCCTCFLSAVALAALDWYGASKVQRKDDRAPSWNVKESLLNLPKTVWLLSIMLGCYYSFLISFISNGGKYFEDKFGYSKTEASYVNGVLYDTSLILCPLAGQLFDRFGYRVVVATAGGLVSIPLLFVLLYTDTNPIIVEVVLGVTYAMIVISLWPSIALVVPLEAVGTGNGLALLMVHAGAGFTNFSIGKMFGDEVSPDRTERLHVWSYVFFLQLAQLGVVALAGFMLHCADLKSGLKLHRKKQNKTYTVLVNDTEAISQCPGKDEDSETIPPKCPEKDNNSETIPCCPGTGDNSEENPHCPVIDDHSKTIPQHSRTVNNSEASSHCPGKGGDSEPISQCQGKGNDHEAIPHCPGKDGSETIPQSSWKDDA